MKPALEKLGLKVYMEPGRSISANAGVLLTKVDLSELGTTGWISIQASYKAGRIKSFIAASIMAKLRPTCSAKFRY
jgi:diaminopimelate decarboxylase